MPPAPLVRAIRSGFVESVHAGHVAVVDAEGRLVASLGDPDRVTYARSSMKPLQAAVSLLRADEDLPDDELAVMCGSHNGEEIHIEAVRRVLDRAGLDAGALRTPPSRPLDDVSAREVRTPAPIFHNCSGKHAGMLLACARRGEDLSSYRDQSHPLQVAVLAAVAAAARTSPAHVGVDGCGVPVHALPVAAMARLFASLAAGAVEGGGRAVTAMRAAPYLVAGRGRVCTAVMERADVAVKVGAEGLICAAIPAQGLGVAIKIEDGGTRALDPALIRTLRLLDVLDDAAEADLADFARPPVLGGGEPVGELVADFTLAG